MVGAILGGGPFEQGLQRSIGVVQVLEKCFSEEMLGMFIN